MIRLLLNGRQIIPTAALGFQRILILTGETGVPGIDHQ
jgi:hypothetical protein